MFSFQTLGNKIKQNSEEKLNAYVHASWYGNTFLVFILMIFFNSFFSYLRLNINNIVFLIFNMVVLFVLFYYLASRRAGIGITDNRIVYVQFGHVKYNVKKVYEIPIDKIKMITVRKILNFKTVKISFVSDVGKIEKVKFIISSFALGIDASEYSKNFNELYRRLCEIEKIVDKGDF